MLRFVRLGALLLLVLAATVYGQAQAKSPNTIIQVNPGSNAIKKALKHANPGDTLSIHAGTYHEAVRVKKPNLTLKAAGDGTVVIDAQCNAVTALNLEAEGITIQGLTVRGATFYDINIEHLASGTVRNNTVTSSCEGAEYGVNVFDGGSIQVIGNQGSGWDDAVIYIGGINATPSGALLVKKNNTSGSTRGIIIEDSTNVDIQVLKNKVHDNTDTGILIHNSDEIIVNNNTVTNNTNNGIHLDEPSSLNTVNGNTATGHTYDINNEGAANCFADNTYETSNGEITGCKE